MLPIVTNERSSNFFSTLGRFGNGGKRRRSRAVAQLHVFLRSHASQSMGYHTERKRYRDPLACDLNCDPVHGFIVVFLTDSSFSLFL